MCGGRGTRLRPEIEGEKPLLTVGGRPMIAHVLSALRESRIETMYAAVSPATPETAAFLETAENIHVIETAGEGYVADLGAALGVVESPVVTVTADLSLLAADHVDRLITEYRGHSLSVCVPLSVAEGVLECVETTLDAEGTTVVPTGLNVVGESDGQQADGESDSRRLVWDDRRLALNVNRPADRRRADRWLSDST